MNKTILLRSVIAAAFVACASAASAESEVISSGGTSSDDFACTVGELVVDSNAGMWATATEMFNGIGGIFADGEVVVENTTDGKLVVKLPDELVAKGAFYNIYNLNGLLLDRNRIESTTSTVKYDKFVKSAYIIVTIETARGIVGTFKISK